MDIAVVPAPLLAQMIDKAGAGIRAEPQSLAMERFNAIMNGVSEGAATGVAAGVAGVSTALAAPVSPTLGSQILSGLNGVAGDVSDKWKGIAQSLDGLAKHATVSDMLRVQTELLQVSIQYELVGKAVARSTQNIDTLVRMS